jgi:hypothetical protein
VNNPITDAAVTFSVLCCVSLAMFGVLFAIDFGTTTNPLALFGEPGAVSTLTSFSEVTVGVLGIAITVVAIIVELAATRYTPRITELFVRDPINRAAMSLFVVSSVLVVWINASMYGPNYPRGMALAAVALMSISVLAILPYFAYVFDFLSPTRVIQRIQQKASWSIERLAKGNHDLGLTRSEVATSVEQLGDIALNSVDKKDKPLTIAAVNALATVSKTHLTNKPTLPKEWFNSSVLVRTDQDFIAFHPDIVRTLTHRRTWLEMKVLRQYQSVFIESINKTRDINHLIAIQTRRIALFALDNDDRFTMNLCIRFLNTYMRAAINAQDMRTCYNLSNEYRALAESAADRGADDVVLELAERIKYYGQLAFARKLIFILDTAAYDLCALLEQVSDANAPCHDALLAIFLDVDREPEGHKSQETSLRGVRKAQIKLATHYLTRGREDLARRIYDDMKAESAERLDGIRRQLEAVDSAEFWEVSDRGINFEYWPDDRRAQLSVFFGWFDAT